MSTPSDRGATDHDQELARAFDSQAPMFERAPVQSDPAALVQLVHLANLPADSLILDAGCGPGLVSAAFLAAGHRVVGADLSGEMIERAQKRCAAYGERARFLHVSLFDECVEDLGPFDATLSRYVLHHIVDPAEFLARQVDLIRPGSVLVVSDHVTDPDAAIARHHNAIEIARDKTHTRNLTGGELIDLFAAAGLVSISFVEESFVLDFDEWFDRGTPSERKAVVRDRLLAGPAIRTFRANLLPSGAVRIDGIRATLRGMKP